MSKDKKPKGTKRYQPLHDYVVLKCEKKKSLIDLSAITGAIGSSKPGANRQISIERITVYAAGPDCKYVKAGDEVVVPDYTLNKVNAALNMEKLIGLKDEDHIYIKTKEEDIIGKIEPDMPAL